MNRTLILHDALGPSQRPDEADVLATVAQVAAALRALGCDVTVSPVGLDLRGLFDALTGADRPAVVWNLVESAAGLGRLAALAAQVVEATGVAMTGCPAAALAGCGSKVAAKAPARAAGILVPRAWDVAALQRLDVLPEPVLVKAEWEHASVGLGAESVFAAGAAASAVAAFAAGRAAQFGSPFFAEAFIDGREFNIGVLDDGAGGPQVLPIAELVFADWPAERPRIVDYRAKWQEDSDEARQTVRHFVPADDPLLATLRALAVQCWWAYGLRGYARVDVRLSGDGRPWLLEVNPNPALDPSAGFCAAAAQAGIDFSAVIERIHVAAAGPRGLGAAPALAAPAGPAVSGLSGMTSAAHDAVAAGMRLRCEPTADDVGRIEALVRATGYFRADEVEVAVELVEERRKHGDASGYHFLLLEEPSPTGWILRGYTCYGAIACTIGSYDLYWIAVDPTAQGRGLGRRLLRATEQRIAEAGGRMVYAETSGKAAYADTRAFYVRCGYRLEAELADFYEPGDAKVVFARAVGGGAAADD